MNAHQIVLFDTEFTAWPGSKERGWSEAWEHKEVIQLAAVKVELNDTGVNIISTFNEIVRPSHNPRLSDYIIELTGISQHMVDEMGVDFPSALALFYQFCEQGALPYFCWGYDGLILKENANLHRLPYPQFSREYINLHGLVKSLGVDGAEVCSGELTERLQLAVEGHKHNALFDVKSIAAALDYWVKMKQLRPSDLIHT